MKNLNILAVIAILGSISQVQAWDYNCATQSAAGHQISMSINNFQPMGIASARYQVDGQQTEGYPVMNDNGTGSFQSPNKDMTVDIDQFTDEDGTYTVYLTVNSLHLKRVALSCL